LDFGASGRHHTLYDELLGAPPQGVEYVVPQIPVSRFPKAAVGAYQKIRRSLDGKLDLASLARKLNRARKADCDMVHLANHLDDVGKPFVADFEQALSFLHAHTSAETVYADFDRVRTARTQLMESHHCKFLLPWTREGAKCISQAFPSKAIREKTRVVHLSMRVPQNHAPLGHRKFRVLFLGTSNLKGDWNFYSRGGRTMLRVFEKFARGKEDVELVITGEVPERERANLAKIPHYVEAGLLPKEKLEEAFRTADVFFYPSYATPGLAFLEAMRYHLPIVTTDAWANEEVVQDKVNGLVSRFRKFNTHGEFNMPRMREVYTDFELKGGDKELDSGLLKNLDALYNSTRLRHKLGERGFRDVSSGEHSIGVRNGKLREIYEQCIRK